MSPDRFQEWRRSQRPRRWNRRTASGRKIERAIANGAYPQMAALSESIFDFSLERVRDFGLANLLDGLEAYVKRQGARGAGEDEE